MCPPSPPSPKTVEQEDQRTQTETTCATVATQTEAAFGFDSVYHALAAEASALRCFVTPVESLEATIFTTLAHIA